MTQGDKLWPAGQIHPAIGFECRDLLEHSNTRLFLCCYGRLKESQIKIPGKTIK